ncbi:unnamed protein product [Ilex paraguariensis]|uniref:Large ribosomal subunit protein bL28c n=1 Tax=Ilex paraguariensis TaxID=185542 RepID=A0ABC8RME3_9AQUA
MGTITATTGLIVGHSFRAQFSLSSNRPLLETKKVGSELRFVTSQLSGLKISSNQYGRICPFTGKKANKANKVSHSNHKTRKWQYVNLQYKKIWWEAGKRYVKLRLSTKAIKTIEKNGLDAVAKKAGIDLRKE